MIQWMGGIRHTGDIRLWRHILVGSRVLASDFALSNDYMNQVLTVKQLQNRRLRVLLYFITFILSVCFLEIYL